MASRQLTKVSAMRRLALIVVVVGTFGGVPGAFGLVGDEKKAEPDDPKVSVVPNGYAYHKSARCVALHRSKTINEITLTEATLMGLKPCGQCNPPVKEIALDKATEISLEKLLLEAKEFDGKRVQINGTVAEVTQLGGAERGVKTMLVVAHEAKKITVFSNQSVELHLNDKVVITGKFSKETSKIDASPIFGKIEVQSKPAKKAP
jgi:hypothetical protein